MMTIPPMQDKTYLDLSNHKQNINLAKELVRDSTRLIMECRRAIATSEQSLVRARQLQASVHPRRHWASYQHLVIGGNRRLGITLTPLTKLDRLDRN